MGEFKVNRNYAQRYYLNPLNWVVMLLALMTSWYFNHSVLWAIFHWAFGGIYLIYVVLSGQFANGEFMNMIHYYF
jgi:hypothetical protein